MSKAKDRFFIALIALMLVMSAAINKSQAATVQSAGAETSSQNGLNK